MATVSTLVVKLIGETGPFVTAMEKAAKEAKSGAGKIADALGTLGKVAAGAAVAGIGAVTAAAIGSLNVMQDWAGTLDSLGDVLGTNADESAALAVAIRGVGGNVEDITSQMARFAGGLKNAKGELGPTGLVMQQLGIAFEDANGNMLSTPRILENVANKLSLMPDGLEKTAILTDLFGKSGKDLGDSLNALANGGMDAALKKAQAYGLAIGDEGVAKSIEFQKSLENLKMIGEGLAVSIGNTLLPMLLPLIEKFAAWAQEVLPKVRDALISVFAWLEKNVLPILNDVLAGNWEGVWNRMLDFIRNIDWGAVLQGIVKAIEGIWSTLAQILETPFNQAKNTIIMILLIVEKFFVDLINGVIDGINNFTDNMARTLGVVNDLRIERLRPRTVSMSSGGFAWGEGNDTSDALFHPASPGISAGGMQVNINLAPGQTRQQGEDAAGAFIQRVRAQGLIVP